jgi:hypothetical protein
MPEAAPASAVDTSMQTDAYDPDELSLWVSTDDEEDASDADTTPVERLPRAAAPAPAPAADRTDARSPMPAPASTPHPAADVWHADDVSTAPIDLSAVADHPSDDAEEREAERASRAAFQRWTSSDSE